MNQPEGRGVADERSEEARAVLAKGPDAAGQSPAGKGKEMLPVIERTRDLLKWLLPHLNNFPKTHRFVLGDKMENEGLELLLRLTEAAYTRERGDLLRKSNLHLEKLRQLMKLAMEIGCFTSAQHKHAAALMREVGMQIGGWMKHSAMKS